MKKKSKNRPILYGYHNLLELSERALRNLDVAMDNAHDVAVMRYVLLQFYNWFKTGYKELPLLERDPFADCTCNLFVKSIFDYMRDITKEKNKNKV